MIHAIFFFQKVNEEILVNRTAYVKIILFRRHQLTIWSPLFSHVSAARSGFDFENIVPQDAQRNILFTNKSYYLNGSGVAAADFNKDGYSDALLAGNMYDSEIETSQNDVSVGICVLGDGKGNFTPLAMPKSGLFAHGNVKDMIQIKGTTQNNIIVANNNQYTDKFYW